MNKKTKIITGVCLPTATLGASLGLVAVGIALANRNKPVDPVEPEVGDYKVTFNPGEGRITKGKASIKVVSGQALNEIKQPTVQSDNGMFEGWYDENGNKMFSAERITRDTTLTARYANDITGIYSTVRFHKAHPGESEEGIEMYGVPSALIKTNFRFYMVNRPTVTKTGQYFRCWQYYNGTTYVDIAENTKITANMELYPAWETAYTVTFTLNGGTLRHGSMTTTVIPSSQTQWQNVNKPDLANGYDEITKWEKRTSTSPETWVEIGATELVSGDMYVRPVWERKSDVHGVAHFITNTDQSSITLSFTGNVNQMYTKSTTAAKVYFSNVYRPKINVSSDYTLKNWAYTTTNPTTGTPTWTDIADESTFDMTMADIWFRPVMQTAVSNVYVSGSDQIMYDNSAIFNSYIIGGGNSTACSQDTKWTLYDAETGGNVLADSEDDATAKGNRTYFNLNIGGSSNVVTLVMKPNATPYEAGAKVYLEATAKNTSVKADTRTAITVFAPYSVYPNNIWIHKNIGTDSNPNYVWRWINPDELYDSTASTIHIYEGTPGQASPTSSTVSRTAFNEELFFGDKMYEIRDDFLSGCTSFNSPINFNNVKLIRKNFMYNCTSFNKTLNLSNVLFIGDNFMRKCYKFNNGYESGTSIPLNISSVLEIGNMFLAETYASGTPDTGFNQPITFGSGLTWIGDSFLFNAKLFNQDIAIPAGINHIGDFFMKDCWSFISTLTVSTTKTLDEVFGGDSHAVSCSVKNSPLQATLSTGFKLAGTRAAEFKTKYPENMPTEGTTTSYRHYAPEFSNVFTTAPGTGSGSDNRVWTDNLTATQIGVLTKTSYTVDVSKIDNYSLTVEPQPEPEPVVPSEQTCTGISLVVTTSESGSTTTTTLTSDDLESFTLKQIDIGDNESDLFYTFNTSDPYIKFNSVITINSSAPKVKFTFTFKSGSTLIGKVATKFEIKAYVASSN